MRFAALGYIDEKKWNALSNTEREAFVEECFAYDSELSERGHWVEGGQALQSVRRAKTLRRTNGNLLITDGPFAETKEQLGSIGVLEATDMDHAIELMSKHPGVHLGGPFEIRPIDEAMGEHCKSFATASNPPANGKKFVCLAYGDERNWNVLSKQEQNAMFEECIAYGELISKHSGYVGGEALQSATTAKTLRFSSGRVLVTDGPYAETKEQVGGLAIFVFKDMDHAVGAWSNHPCLRMGDALEVRPADEEFNAQWEARQKQIEVGASR